MNQSTPSYGMSVLTNKFITSCNKIIIIIIQYMWILNMKIADFYKVGSEVGQNSLESGWPSTIINEVKIKSERKSVVYFW